MKIIKSSFTKNLAWKFLSLFFAIILWLIAVGIEDPLVIKSYNVPIEIKNINKLNKNKKIILNKEDINKNKANIKITGRRSDFKGISASNIKAYIDLESIDCNNMEKIDSIDMPLKVEISSIFSSNRLDISTKPSNVKLNIDNLITKEFKIKINKSKDISKPYIALETVIDPQVVEISGAESILNKINCVNIDLNLEGVKKDFISNLQPIVYDRNKNDITSSIILNTPHINVSIPVKKIAKIPILKPETIGEIEQGYKLLDITYTPDYIEAVGKVQDIESIESIKLDSIDISNISSEKIEKYNIKNLLKESNLIPLNNTQEDIIVKVIVEKENIKKISIPIENFEIIGENKNIYYPKYIETFIEGKDTLIKDIDINKIKGTIKIEGANIEKNIGEISLELPEGVFLSKEHSIIKLPLNNLKYTESIENNNEYSQEDSEKNK